MADRESGKSFICIVDDDVSFREALEGLISSFGYDAFSYGSAQDFLESGRRKQALCLILDVQMSGMSGLELQAQLAATGQVPPTIFISSFDDVRTRAMALNAGAIGFLGKPFDRDALMAIIGSVAEPS